MHDSLHQFEIEIRLACTVDFNPFSRTIVQLIRPGLAISIAALCLVPSENGPPRKTVLAFETAQGQREPLLERNGRQDKGVRGCKRASLSGLSGSPKFKPE